MLDRREFLKLTGAAGVAAGVWGLFPRRAQAFYVSPAIPLYQTKLRGIGRGGLTVASTDPLGAPVTGVRHFTIGIQQFQDQILPRGFNKTTLWGFHPAFPLGGNQPPSHLGGIVVAKKGVPFQMTFKNLLPSGQPIIPVDTTIPGANQAVNRTAIHMHGSLPPWISDGGPFDWFDPTGAHGLSFLNNQVLNPKAPAGQAEYYYPMNQSARMLWYHDHALGITRTNAYAGLATVVLIRDAFEKNLVNMGMPDYIEVGCGEEVPLVFQDKTFVGPDIAVKDPTWNGIVQPAAAAPGSLWYPHEYDPARWPIQPGGLPVPSISCVPEAFGDTMLVNGTVFPKATVEATRYRLRLLNACNARFLNLQLYVADASPEGITLDPATGKPLNTPYLNPCAGGTPNWFQIGNECGFLANPVLVPSNVPWGFKGAYLPDPVTGQTDPSQILHSLVLGPAERADLLVDFTGLEGKSAILYSDAPSPYPGGDDRNDYFPGFNFGTGLNGVGNPANTAHPGVGPNTRVLMRIDIVPKTGRPEGPLKITTATDFRKGIDPFFVDPATLKAGVPAPPGITTRFLTLNESADAYGRLIQILGNAAAPLGSPLDGSASYLEVPPRTQASTVEAVASGATEVWEIFNTTGDVHPMHFHLVNVQVINRQLFDVTNLAYNTFTGPIIPPEDNELGWKETVKMFPGTVTRCLMKFDLTGTQIKTKAGAVIPTPPSPRTGGNEYVWHCHILEHEEHDMMHAMVVQ